MSEEVNIEFKDETGYPVLILVSSNGKRWKVTASDAGELETTELT